MRTVETRLATITIDDAVVRVQATCKQAERWAAEHSEWSPSGLVAHAPVDFVYDKDGIIVPVDVINALDSAEHTAWLLAVLGDVLAETHPCYAPLVVMGRD